MKQQIFIRHVSLYMQMYCTTVKLKLNDIRRNLFEQVTSPVRWEETIHNMINDGIEEFYEIGPGKVLQGLVKRINPDVKCFGIDKYTDVEKYL